MWWLVGRVEGWRGLDERRIVVTRNGGKNAVKH